MSDQPDSTADTLAHIQRVNTLLLECIDDLSERAKIHDKSKLFPPEKELFDTVPGRLKGITYGSPEYKACLAELKPALDHHYAHNRHHPEHFQKGVDGMNLLDVLEMLMDWKAASERHADGCIFKSIKINTERFNLSPQLVSILTQTAIEFGWRVKDVEYGGAK